MREKSIEDYDSEKVNELKDEIRKVLRNQGEIYNYNMKDNINWDDIGWSQSTGEKVLVHMRRDLKSKGLIEVKEEDKEVGAKKTWKPQDISGIEEVSY